MAADTQTGSRSEAVTRGPSGLPVTAWVLREQRRSTVGWAIALAVICAIYAAFYPSMGGDEMTDLIATLPDAIVEGLGYGAMGTAAGYLDATVFSLLAPALMLVFAIGFGARVVAGQEEDGTLELELTMPIDRRRVLLERFLALVAQLALLACVVFAVVATMAVALDMDVALTNVAAATLGLFLLALAMGTVGLGVGAATGRKATGLAAGAGVAVAGFMANVLSPMIEGAAWLENVSPFGWYLGGDPLTEGIDPVGFAALLIVTLVGLAVSVPIYARRDVGV